MTEKSPEIETPKSDTEAELAKPAASPDAAIEPVKPEPAATDVPLLRIEGVGKKFGNFRAVDRAVARHQRGRVLRAARPERLRQDHAAADARRLRDAGRRPHPARRAGTSRRRCRIERPVNMMFQNYALFPHLSVRDNIAFGLKRAGMARADIATRVARDGRAGQARGHGEAQAGPAFRRPEAARGAGALAGAPSAGAAARRAAGGARQEAAREHAARIDGAAAPPRHDLHHRHPRPGRGDDGGRTGSA